MWISQMTIIRWTCFNCLCIVFLNVIGYVNCAPAFEVVYNNGVADVKPELVGHDNSDLPSPHDMSKTALQWIFGYGKSNGPMIWYKNFRDCGGVHQSPINLDTTNSPIAHRPHLFWWNYNLKPETMTVTNNGHTAVLQGNWPSSNEVPYYWHSTGKPEEENYAFDHIHFHWGSNDSVGSEHTINHVRYPLEMHAVHYLRKYSDIKGAINDTQGLRVVAILFALSEHENLALRPIVTALKHVRKHATSVKIEPFELRKLVPTFSNFFLTYNGSLTSPPCAETVTWVVRIATSTVSLSQMEEFRQLLGENGESLSDNFRPVQPVNGRQVWHVR